MTTSISTMPSRLAAIAHNASSQLFANIMISAPKNSVTEVISEPSDCPSVCPTASTSFVMRLITSPLLCSSKYLSGSLFIFTSIAERRRCAVRCVTVAIIQLCTYEHSAYATYSATSVQPMRVTAAMSMAPSTGLPLIIAGRPLVISSVMSPR